VEHDGDIIGFFSQTQLFEAAQAVGSHGGVHMPMIKTDTMTSHH
jgi:hypothetical protein